jgi:signal transduction histidine kinase
MVNIERVMVPLQELVNCVVKKRHRKHQRDTKKKVRVLISIPDHFRVWVDRIHIRESFANIVDNAFNAMPEGGTLTVHCTDNLEAEMVEIVITDTGKGMTEADVAAAKQGFFTSPSGSGIGVLLASLLIKCNGGKFKLESALGSGTQVFIKLPITQTEENT